MSGARSCFFLCLVGISRKRGALIPRLQTSEVFGLFERCDDTPPLGHDGDREGAASVAHVWLSAVCATTPPSLHVPVHHGLCQPGVQPGDSSAPVLFSFASRPGLAASTAMEAVWVQLFRSMGRVIPGDGPPARWCLGACCLSRASAAPRALLLVAVEVGTDRGWAIEPCPPSRDCTVGLLPAEVLCRPLVLAAHPGASHL